MPVHFNETDPRGHTVICLTDDWSSHVIQYHPDLTGKEDDVREAIKSPDFICKDADFEDREVYYRRRPGEQRYTKAVVRIANDSNRYLVTAYKPDGGKRGETLIWLKSSNS